MAQKQTPQSNVDSMFQKMGEKLGWFQYKDLDSAMKTLSDKKKHNKSRLRLRSKQDKENRPVLNLNQQEVHSRELSKENRLKEIHVGSNKEYKEIPLRKSPASTDLTRETSSQEVYHTAPTSPVSKDNQKSKYLKSSSNAIKQNPMSCHQGMASQNFGQKLNEQPKEAHTGNEVLGQSKDSQEKNREHSSQSQKLYNMSVIAGQNDGDLFSMLEDVGVPLVESTRIYSRQSIDVFGLSINEETGENDSYENLQIQQKNKRENRNSDLYSTAVEPENDFYTVTDTATQTGKSLMHKNEKDNSANESISSEEGSLYEVQDVSIQTDPTTDNTIIQSDENLCKQFHESVVISENTQKSTSESQEPDKSGQSSQTPSIIEESQLVLRMDTQDSIPEETPVELKKIPCPQIPSSSKSSTKPKPTPKTKSLKSKIMKNTIDFSDSESGGDFTPVKSIPSTLRKKHKLYTPGNESFLNPSLDDTLSRSSVKSRVKVTPLEKSICQPNAVESYSEMMPKLSEKLSMKLKSVPDLKAISTSPDIPIMEPLIIEDDFPENEKVNDDNLSVSKDDKHSSESLVSEGHFVTENDFSSFKNDGQDSSEISPKDKRTPPLLSEDESALFSDISITASSKPESPPKTTSAVSSDTPKSSNEAPTSCTSPCLSKPSQGTSQVHKSKATPLMKYSERESFPSSDVEFPSPQNSPVYTPVPIKTSSTLTLKKTSSTNPKLSSATKPKPSSATKPKPSSPTKPKPSSATKPKPSSATKHTTSARKVAKMKALLSSSDSEEEMLSPEVRKSKYFTPKPGKNPSVSDTNKSKFFTPKSPTQGYLSDSDDSVTGLNLERYKITIEQPSPSWRSSRVISDSSDDDDFDQFLESVKPQVKPVKEVLERSLSDFIDDDEIETGESDSESEEEIFISIQSPKNRGCTIVSPVSKRYSPSVVDVNKPHRLKTPTSTLHSTPHTSHTERLNTPSTHIHNTLKTPHISHAATRPYSTTCTEFFKTPLRPKELTTPKVRSYSDKPTVHDNHKCSFIKSLTTELDESRRHPDSIKYIKQFKKNYEELTSRLFKLYNETIFDKKLPEDMSITWNKRLLRTAGYCAYKRCHGKHVARIELSTKVCDNAERVRDTLIHELCHAAVWMLNQRTDGHGPYWKYWARKSNLSHPELPIISRCHNYSISTKYTYTCTQCGYQIGRHSKSLDTTKKVCGHCHGRFQLMGTPGSKEGTPRTPNKFALFVKENYGSAKKTNSDFKHKEIMQLLSQQFANKTKLDS